MTEAEWVNCPKPASMLEFLRRGIVVLVDELPTQVERLAIRKFLQGSLARKSRLFACWCCRQIWSELADARSRVAVEVTERFVDGLASYEELVVASRNAIAVRDEMRRPGLRRAAAHTVQVTCEFEVAEVVSESANVLVWAGKVPTLDDAGREQSAIFRDIVGNPFRPMAFDPAWRTSDAVALARGIYDDRAFDRMPILADALQDAGCDNDDILSHCRNTSTPHARGCWVVDLVLGKA